MLTRWRQWPHTSSHSPNYIHVTREENDRNRTPAVLRERQSKLSSSLEVPQTASPWLGCSACRAPFAEAHGISQLPPRPDFGIARPLHRCRRSPPRGPPAQDAGANCRARPGVEPGPEIGRVTRRVCRRAQLPRIAPAGCSCWPREVEQHEAGQHLLVIAGFMATALRPTTNRPWSTKAVPRSPDGCHQRPEAAANVHNLDHTSSRALVVVPRAGANHRGIVQPARPAWRTQRRELQYSVSMCPDCGTHTLQRISTN